MTPKKELDKLLFQIEDREKTITELKEKNAEDRQRVWHLEALIRAGV